jgi:hypothetical protein
VSNLLKSKNNENLRRTTGVKRNLIIIALSFSIMLTVEYADIAVADIIGCTGQASSSTMTSGDRIYSNTSYVLRNFNDTKTININKVVVYDSDGNERCVYPTVAGTFPGTLTGSLLPHQSARFSTNDMNSCLGIQPFPGGSIQVLITWSLASGKFGEPLYVTSTGINLNYDDDETFGWAPVVCSTIVPK